MIEIKPKLFYAVDTGEKDAFSKIVIVETDGDPGKVYYLTRMQIINLIRHLFLRLIT